VTDDTDLSHRHPDLQAFFKSFEDTPGELTAYGAAADLLDEVGYAKLAHAYRWMSFRALWPHKRMWYGTRSSLGNIHRQGRAVPAAYRWGWYGQAERAYDQNIIWSVFPVEPLKYHALPTLLMAFPQKLFPSHQAAVMWLSDRLHSIKSVYAADPKGV
jgi:hypothetical protein